MLSNKTKNFFKIIYDLYLSIKDNIFFSIYICMYFFLCIIIYLNR